MARFPPSFMSAMMQGQSFGGILSSGLSLLLLIIGGGDSVGVATWYFLFATLFLIITLALFIMINKNSFYRLHLDEDNELLVEQKSESVFGHLTVVTRTWMLNVAIFLTHVMVFSVYPALMRLAEPVTDNELWSKYFLPLGVFFSFNFLDFTGRVLAGVIKWPGPDKRGSVLCLLASVLRFGLIPLIMVSNLSPDDRHVTAVLIRSDSLLVR